MLNNDQWLELGIDWNKPYEESVILGVLVVESEVVWFRVIKHGEGGYSIYHKCCGGGGQFQFDTEQQIKSYLETQVTHTQEWARLISKRDALTSRVNPLHKKLNVINAQMDAILFPR